jgi:hypothetical protein
MKKLIKVLVSIISLVVLGIFSAECGSNNVKITKEQQDNVVKILSKNYDIKSIEFQKFEKIYEAGTYRLSVRINDSDEYSTVINVSNIEELSRIEGEWGLDPIENFEKIKRKETITLENIDLKSIKIKYI